MNHFFAGFVDELVKVSNLEMGYGTGTPTEKQMLAKRDHLFNVVRPKARADKQALAKRDHLFNVVRPKARAEKKMLARRDSIPGMRPSALPKPPTARPVAAAKIEPPRPAMGTGTGGLKKKAAPIFGAKKEEMLTGPRVSYKAPGAAKPLAIGNKPMAPSFAPKRPKPMDLSKVSPKSPQGGKFPATKPFLAAARKQIAGSQPKARPAKITMGKATGQPLRSKAVPGVNAPLDPYSKKPAAKGAGQDHQQKLMASKPTWAGGDAVDDGHTKDKAKARVAKGVKPKRGSDENLTERQRAIVASGGTKRQKAIRASGGTARQKRIRAERSKTRVAQGVKPKASVAQAVKPKPGLSPKDLALAKNIGHKAYRRIYGS